MKTFALALFLLGLALIASGDGVQAQGSRVRWECSLDDIIAEQRLCIEASPGGEARYVTDIIFQSTSAIADTLNVIYGIGFSGSEFCTTGGTSLLPAAGHLLAAPANTSGPAVIPFETPLRVPPGQDICVVGNNGMTVHMLGYLAP